MSKYTTGEIAKLCGVTVRTVQYYDSRGILVPSELSDGGRRLYSEEDVNRLKVICYLREIGLSIDSISQLLSEENPGNVISLLLEQQKQVLQSEIDERVSKMEKLEALKRELKSIEQFSIESISDVAFIMENKEKLKKVHALMLIFGIPLGILEIATIVLWIVKGIWWPFVLWLVVDIIFGVWISRYYYLHTAYICPECHKVFRPSFKEVFFARHTPHTRKLTCTGCGHHGFCVETYADDLK